MMVMVMMTVVMEAFALGVIVAMMRMVIMMMLMVMRMMIASSKSVPASTRLEDPSRN